MHEKLLKFSRNSTEVLQKFYMQSTDIHIFLKKIKKILRNYTEIQDFLNKFMCVCLCVQIHLQTAGDSLNSNENFKKYTYVLRGD